VEDVHAANHSWLVHEGEISNGPRDASDLGIDLDEDLVHDGAQVLALSDGVAQNNLGGNRKFGQKESLDVIVQCVLSLCPRHEKYNSLHIRVQLCLQLLDPGTSVHATLDDESLRLSILIGELLQHLVHRGSELLRDLSIAVAVEDSPGLESRLIEHLVLNLAVDVSEGLLDVERIPLSTAFGAHHHFSSLVLDTLELCGILIELQMPQLLLLLALGIGVEHFQEATTLRNLAVSVRVHDLCQVLHEAEVSAHRVSETGDLAELGQKGHLCSSLLVLVDEQRLVGLTHFLIVAGLVVLFVGDLYCKQ